jgi:hypothetical protein
MNNKRDRESGYSFEYPRQEESLKKELGK